MPEALYDAYVMDENSHGSVVEGARRAFEENRRLQDLVNAHTILRNDLDTLLKIPRDLRGNDSFLRRRLTRLVEQCAHFSKRRLVSLFLSRAGVSFLLDSSIVPRIH